MGEMGLNLKLHLCKVIQVTIDSGYIFIQKHPSLSGAFFVLFIIYIFLSYIYSFLVYLSPFLFCTAILVKVFWSSEQTKLKYVRRENKRRDQEKIYELQRCFKKAKDFGKRADSVPEKRYKYSKQRALSRRRNFRDKRILDVVSDVEEKSKVLSTAGSTEKKELDSTSGKEEGSSPSAGKLRLRSEPSMSDLVEAADLADKSSRFDGVGGSELVEEADLSDKRSRFDGVGGCELDNENMECGDDEDEEAQYDREAMEWTEDDQKNLMDIGISETERNKRLESLIARRRARKLFKLQIENGLIDARNVNPNQVSPLSINSIKQSVDFLKNFDDLGMPGSAPSVLRPSRNPFDLPYEPSEEKPILRGDSFEQEFKVGLPKEMTYCRHESFSLGPSFPVESMQDQGDTVAYSFFKGRKASDKLGHQRFKWLPEEKGKHDRLIDYLFSKGDHHLPPSSGDTHDKDEKSKVKPPNPLRNEEAIKYEVVRESTKEIAGEGEENGLVIKSMIAERSEPAIQENNNYGFADIGQEIPHVKYLKKRISHAPVSSVAPDLHVQLSEIGSVDETNTTTDEDSAVYDGDIDKDIITSGSEDMGGASFNSRTVHRIIEQDLADMGYAEVEKNLKDAYSYIVSEQIDEANAADVSSGETPTCAIHFGNVFGYVKKNDLEIKEPQPLDSAYLPSPLQKQPLDSSVDHLLHETHSEKLKELADEVSVNSSSSVSLQSVLPEKTLLDQTSSSAFGQLIMHADVPQSDTEDMTLMTSTGELPPEAMPQNMQPFMKDSVVQSQNDGTISDSQEASIPSEMSDDAIISNTVRKPTFDQPKLADDPRSSNILSKSVFDDAKENNISEIPHNKETADSPDNSIEETNNIVNEEDKVKLKSDDLNHESKSTTVVRQDADVESPKLTEMTTMEHVDEKSRELVDSKATIEPSKMTQENNSTITEDTKMPGSVTKDETTLCHGNHVDDAKADIEAKQGVQDDFLNLTEHEEVHNPEKPEAETDNVNMTTIEEVPSSSLKLESSLEVPKVNIGNESPSMRQEATLEPFISAQATSSGSAKDIEGKDDELNKNEAIISPVSAVEISKSSKMAHIEQPEESAQLDRSEEMRYPQNELKELVEANIENEQFKANDRSEGDGYGQSEPKNLVEDDKKEKLENGDANKDSPQPTATSPRTFNPETNKDHADSS